MADFRPLSDRFSVAEQLQADDLEAAAAAGFRAVICNRPDGESPDQPPAESMARAATRLGLAFHTVPFDMGSLDRGIIDTMAEVVAVTDGPVLAYCRSGTRCSIAWSAMAAREGMDSEAVLSATRAAGYQLDGQWPLIQSLV